MPFFRGPTKKAYLPKAYYVTKSAYLTRPTGAFFRGPSKKAYLQKAYYVTTTAYLPRAH